MNRPLFILAALPALIIASSCAIGNVAFDSSSNDAPIGNASSDSSSGDVPTIISFYRSQRKSLEGETKDIDDISSEADKLTHALMKWSDFAEKGTEYETYGDWRDAYEKSEEKAVIDNAGGTKFYLIYYAGNSSSCDEAQEGFEILQEQWGKRYMAADNRSFAFSSICTDEHSTNNDDYLIENEQIAFNRYLAKFDELGFFADAGARFGLCPYKKNANLTSSSHYINFADAGTKLDAESFVKPTVILVDFSEEAFNLGRVGVSEVLFGVSGDLRYDKATLLMEMWNHTSDDTSNPFSASYVEQ